MSAEDDEDDIWNSDNFIATIEVFLQKAEQESAVKHGTQSVVPSSSSNLPGTSRSAYNNELTSKFGPSSADLKPSNGSAAPTVGYSGRAVDFRNVCSAIRPNENDGHSPILQPLNYQNPWTVREVRDVYTSQQSKGLGHDHSGNLQSAVVECENPALEDILAEKDGAISLLRTRLREAEQQADELRKRVSSQTTLQPAISQQRELERLSSQLLFKEHEVHEVQRVRLEKEQQLKDSLAEAASLRRQLQHLKQSRSTGVDGSKRPRDEGANLQDNSVEKFASGSRPNASIENSIRTSERQHDPWTSPWIPENIWEGPPRKTSQGGLEKNAIELSNRLETNDSLPAVEALKKRTADNGCVSSNKNEPNDCGKAVELKKRETLAQSQETAAGMSELSFSLQQIWGFKSAKNDGKALAAKIYASCSQDLYVLLSNGEYKRPVDCRKMERRKVETLSLSEKFHSAIAKVTKGSAHPEIILGPLLEFCSMENAKLVGSALRVLHCVLQHDEGCRQRLVGGRKQGCEPQSPLPVESHLEEKDKLEEAKCGFRVSSKALVDGETKQLPVFSSPRIIVRSKGGETSETGLGSKGDALNTLKKHGEAEISANVDQRQRELVQNIEVGFKGKMGSVASTPDTKDPSAKSGVDPGSEKLMSVNEQQSAARQETEKDCGGGGTNSHDEELDPFLKWMMHLAVASASPVVRLEAAAIIGVLVVHSEPLVGRLMFGSLLKHEGLDTLLKETAGVEMQLQAVRIVHHLLHCPTLYRKICTSITEEQTVNPNSNHEFIGDTKLVLDEPIIVEGSNLGNPADQLMDALTGAKACTSGPSAGLTKRKLLAGLSECLKFTGTSLQGYALRRNVMRLITYVASCGDAGVVFLTQPVTTNKNGADELTRICNDDTKADGMPLGESASGQHLAGEGSGLKGLDVRGRIFSGSDDMEAGAPDSREAQGRGMNIPERLVTLLGAELESHDEGESESSLVEERACLVREVATLLSCLASHPVQSEVVLDYLISSPRIARLTLSVINDLVSKKSLLQVSGTCQKHVSRSSSETVELCKSLRRRVMTAIAEASASNLKS